MHQLQATGSFWHIETAVWTRWLASQRVSKHTLMKARTQPASVVFINHDETATWPASFQRTVQETGQKRYFYIEISCWIFE